MQGGSDGNVGGGGASGGGAGPSGGSNGDGGGSYSGRSFNPWENEDNPGFMEEQIKKLSPQEKAALAIKEGLEKAGKITKKGTKRARKDLQPFKRAGIQQLSEIQNLLTPEGQNEFITNNPFFDALAQDAQDRLFNNSAARGKVGSGGTAEALQNSILLMGNDLVDNDINRRMPLANMGFNAAQGQANITTAGSLNLAELSARGGETQAAGILGLENTRRQDKSDSRSDVFGLATAGLAALSDRRMKTDIKPLGSVKGIPMYIFKYKGSDKFEVGTMAQDVQHIPGAVSEIGGSLYVDYARL